jgi:hypothetical protein
VVHCTRSAWTRRIELEDLQHLEAAMLRAHKLVGFLQCSLPVDVFNLLHVISEVADLSFRVASFVFRKHVFLTVTVNILRSY